MTAPNEKPTTKSSSRRALLAGALGGIGAVAAGAVAKVNPVRAEGQAVVVGGEYLDATSRTYLRNQANNNAVLVGESDGGGPGVVGQSGSNNGVLGISDSGTGVSAISNTSYGVEGLSTSGGTGVFGTSGSGTGVRGSSGTSYGMRSSSNSGIALYAQSTDHYGVYGNSANYIGIYGYSGASGLPAVRARSGGNSTGLLGISGGTVGPKPKTGVYGYANQDSASKGVWGFSGPGVGVYGKANKAGHAFRGSGRVKFDKVSGVATIPAGSTGVTVSPPVNIASGSFVLLTPRTNLGGRDLWYVPHPTQDNFRIRMSSARSSNTKVAWLLLG